MYNRRLWVVASCLLFGACAQTANSGDVSTVVERDAQADGAAEEAEAGAADSQDSALPDAMCGDGAKALDEACDDGNTLDGDGCAADCQAIENGFVCPEAGKPCHDTAVCGDRHLSPREQCEDGNTDSGDGCDGGCKIEAGYACRVAGAACGPKACGDGLRAGREQCDDGNSKPGDGCGPDCLVEAGYVCPADGACRETRCGDGVVEGSEQCDDRNQLPYDGCYRCQREPDCQNKACAPVCGDGLKYPSEACDDGNTQNGDGCSSDCAVEPGFTCETLVSEPPATLEIPVVYRDIRGSDLPAIEDKNIAEGHPDFERIAAGAEAGIVQNMLGADKTPAYAKEDGSSESTTSAANFRSWYHDDPRLNRKIAGTLSLTRQQNGDYVYEDAEFFPLDGLGFMAEDAEPARNGGHNFSFTSELRTWFTYQGDEKLDFEGDDDVWVFINGRLAVDLGGVHPPLEGSVTLDSESAAAFGLKVGEIYELSVFQAERHTTESNYKLTLRRFDRASSQCRSRCGDGVVTPDEVCDDRKNDGSYGSCTADCKGFAPFCGDGKVQSPQEMCDDGNTTPTDSCDNACRPFNLL